jgi:hypothetical protein
MAKSINYNARNFDDYRSQITAFTQKYYPNIINDFQDASVGSFLMDLNAAIGDDLGFYIDNRFQETQLDYMQDRKSLISAARTNGLNVPGKRPSMLEAVWSCYLPVDSTNANNTPDWSYAPVLNKGTQASGGGQNFELQENLNFSQQFNSLGVSDRTIIPLRNSTNGGLVGYTITKTCIMTSGESKIYKQTVSPSDVTPFMEVILPDPNVIDVQSILIFDGYNQVTPSISDFVADSANRWYEVGNLTDDKMFGKDILQSTSFTNKLLFDLNQNGITGLTSYGNTYMGQNVDGSTVYGYIPSAASWSSVTQKFITEYTDNYFLKVIFGAGSNKDMSSINMATDYTQYQLNKAINNKYLGMLPTSNSTMYIYYTVGGGSSSNIAINVMNTVGFLDITIGGAIDATVAQVNNSLTVTNTTPSVSGRDELSNEELRYLIKYNNLAQDRCVTVNDYKNRILTMPSEYGAPLKVGVEEINNKILITMLGLDYDGTLSSNLSETLINNIIEYLTEYKMPNDYVEIQPGLINNLQFEVDLTVDINKSAQDIVKTVILYIGNSMDINNYKMGDEIYCSNMKSDIGAIDGVTNLIDFRVYSIYATGYSPNQVKQPIITTTQQNNRVQIDLVASDGILYSDSDTMYEIKNPKVDIIVRTKSK